MALELDGYLLRIFVGEHEKKDGKPLYEWIIHTAKATGLAGASVIRAMEGYGAHSKIHSSRVLDMSADLPIIVEIIDSKDKIEAFLPTLDNSITKGLATVSPVHVRFYRPQQ